MAINIAEFKKKILRSQCINIGILFLGYLFVLAVEYFKPGFFQYPYLKWTTDFDTLYKFRTLFLYAGLMATFSAWVLDLRGDTEAEKTFFLSIIVSTIAGIWEELGFRWLYICYAMVMITIFNSAFSWIISIVVLIGFAIWGLRTLINRGIVGIMLGLVIFAIGGFLTYASFQTDPLFWLYREITVPFVNWITFKQFSSIFYNGYPELFVFGMILTNAWFRDGHKYQGPIGIVNSWVIGFVMMYAMLNYGLMTAIVLHIIYDIEFDIITYLGMKMHR